METYIFDLVAKLIMNIENNKSTVHLVKSTRNGKDEVETKKEIFDKYKNQKAIENYINKLIKIKDVKMVYAAIALDEYIGDITKNDTYNWITPNVKNSTYLNSIESYEETKIKVFLSFQNEVNKERENVYELGSLFKNIVYYMGDSIINNIFIKNCDTNFKDKKKFKVAFLPFSKNYSTGYLKEIEGDKHLLTPFFDVEGNDEAYIKYQPDLNAEKRILNDLNKSLNKYDFIIMPETFSNDFAKKIYECAKNSNSFVIGPAFYEKCDDNKFISKAYIISHYLKSRKVFVRKNYPYQDKIIDGISYAENIEYPEKCEYTVLHIEGIGRILVIICSDMFVVARDEKLIDSMNIDFVFIISATPSYNEFDSIFSGYRKQNRLFLQCNLCSECKSECTKAPINISNGSIIKIEEKPLDLNALNNKTCICLENKSCIISLTIEKKEGLYLLKTPQKNSK